MLPRIKIVCAVQCKQAVEAHQQTHCHFNEIFLITLRHLLCVQILLFKWGKILNERISIKFVCYNLYNLTTKNPYEYTFLHRRCSLCGKNPILIRNGFWIVLLAWCFAPHTDVRIKNSHFIFLQKLQMHNLRLIKITWLFVLIWQRNSLMN